MFNEIISIFGLLGIGGIVGGVAGIGAKVGSSVIKIPDEIFIGKPNIDYGAAGGLIGETIGTILTQDK